MVSGALNAKRVRLAKWALHATVVCVFLWSFDMSIIYMWRMDYGTQFWLMSLTVFMGMLTFLITGIGILKKDIKKPK